jgi:hypothetical protein
LLAVVAEANDNGLSIRFLQRVDMTKPKDNPKLRSITLNPNQKGEFKILLSRRLEYAARSGGLKELNRDFKAARAADSKLRYQDYLYGRKAAMLEALAVRPQRG